MTPLLTAARKDFAAVLGAHALHKAVHAFATAVVRLKRPLHLYFPYKSTAPSKGLAKNSRLAAADSH
jgi:hypothetical protein